MFQQKTPEDSAFVTVFLVWLSGLRGLYVRYAIHWAWRLHGVGRAGSYLLAGGVHVLVGGEHYVGRVEGEVVELGVAAWLDVSQVGFWFMENGGKLYNVTYGAKLSTPVWLLRVLIQPMGRGTTHALRVVSRDFFGRSVVDGSMYHLEWVSR